MKTIIDFANKVKSLVDGRMSNIANVETSPSTHPYTVGKQLIFNGLLCKATSAIAVGDTLAVGTNLALSDNVVEQIYSLNQGLTNSLNEISDMNNVLGAKNILPNIAETKTVGGVTRTANADGSITLNGTSTGWGQSDVLKGLLPKGTYKISIGTPLPSNVWATLRNEDTSTSILNIGNGSSTVEGSFTLSSDTNVKLFCGIEGGVTVNNLTFYPMLRPASIQDDTYVPYSMTNREMTPYVQSISNPNLLDNPWFTVNQRGASSYNSGYSIDRWRVVGSAATLTVNSDSIVLTTSAAYNNLMQPIEKGVLKDGQTYTLSLLLGDGTIFSKSFVFKDSSSYKMIYNTTLDGFYGTYRTAPNYIEFIIIDSADSAEHSVTIKAAKLELGSVSTLAQDVAPNYAIELAKCRTSTADSSDTYANQGQINISKEDDDYWISDSFGTNTLISYIRKNNVVTVSIAWWGTGSTIKNSDVIYTLPVKYRPGISIFTANAYINQNSNIWIGSDGKINVETNNQSGIIDYGRATISYIVI